MAFAFCNGRDIAYSDNGGTGPAVIFMHGCFLDRTMFDAQLEALASQRRVIAWDARGHGETPDDGESFTYWDHAKDLFSLMDVLGIESATVGGVSQGGFTSMRAALLAPDHVDALLLFDTEATPVDPGDKIAYSQLFAS